MSDELVHIKGKVEHILFHNDENDYTVLRLLPDDSLIPITVVGIIPAPRCGQILELWGRWEIHKKHGKQLKIEDFRANLPRKTDALAKYLASDLVKGIGRVYAERIVEKFGENTIDVIFNHPKRLLEVKGIGEKRARKIIRAVREAYREQKALPELAAFLMEHNFGTGMVRRIWRRYGESGINVVKQNPYALAEEVWGIGFITADRLAKKIGISDDDPRRISAGIIYTLRRGADKGHCYIPQEELIANTATLLNAEPELVKEVLNQSAATEKVINDDGKIYLPMTYSAEVGVAQLLMQIATFPPSAPISVAMAESLFNETQRVSQISFTSEQRRAIIEAIAGKVLVITGGPGTGKTTIVQAILLGAKKLRWCVKLAAPTGRAAKKMEEATKHKAQTIHRLLKFNPGLGRFEFGRANPITADMLILDEVSMIDLELMWRVLDAISPQTRLVLVGDADQLPSVGPGAVLRDIISSGKIPVVRLNKILRQNEHGLIVRNAHIVLNGKTPIIRNNPADDFFFLQKNDAESAQKAVVELVCRRIPKKYGFDPINDIQVITPMHKGLCGVNELNTILRNRLNLNAQNEDKLKFAIGDKVMQIANNYEIGVFNGEIGTVIAADADKREIVVRFAGFDATYDPSFLAQLQLAYAITVHKSQGSEYPAVVMPLLTEHFIMLARNLLYTAITRAKRLLVLVGSKKALQIAISNSRPMNRYTALAERIEAQKPEL